ncbi:MAG: hypothetical protein ABJY83_17815 [Roseibium sp.]
MNLLDGHAEALSEKAIELALAGDTTVLRLCLDRILPTKRDTLVDFDFPDEISAKNVEVAAQSVVRSVAAGELTPLEASRIMPLFEILRKAIETSELEARISELKRAT